MRIDPVRKLLSRIALLLFLWVHADVAWGHPFELSGFSSRAQSMGNPMSAIANDYTAVYYNPAALIEAEGFQVGFEYFYLFSDFEVNGEAFEIDDSDVSGFFLGTSICGRIKGRRIAAGAAAAIPDQATIRVRILPATQPRFVLVNNQTQRAELIVALAAELYRGLSVDDGFAAGAILQGEGINIQGNILGRLATSSAGVDIQAKITPMAGLYYGGLKRLKIGLCYRGPLYIGVQSTATANLSLTEGFPILDLIDTDLVLQVTQKTFYSPQQVVLGAAWKRKGRLTIAADLTWTDWSRYPVASPSLFLEAVGVLSVILDDIPPFDVSLVEMAFEDTFDPRIGIEYLLRPGGSHEIALRAGYMYKRSPVPEQSGVTNYLDNDQHVFCVGLGLSGKDRWGILPKPVRIDLHFQYFHLHDRDHRKDDPTDPVGDISSGGARYCAGTTITLCF